MGKVKPRILGMEEVEAEQKKEQKEKAAQKKMAKKKEVVVEEGKVEKKVEVKKTEKPKEKKARKVVVKTKSKKYAEAEKLIDKNKSYSLSEAMAILKKMKLTSFDSSIELHFVVDETGLKGELTLPHGTGKKVKVTVVDDKVLSDLESGKINFDILVTHPSFMPRLAKFAKVLGPRGLMPNPKAGTISPNPEAVVKKFEGGMLRWKTEPKFPLIHQMIGRQSFEEKQLVENAIKLIEAIGLKHILKGYAKSTMGPSVKIDLQK